MSAVPYGDRNAMVAAIMGAIKQGGLFAVDVDIIPTKIGQACHVWLPAATSGEMNLTSMNGERRMRLTERYMDPPGQAMPDCLVAARIANNMERVLREQGKNQQADQFKGFDWKTEEDAFMDGYAKHEKGGEFVTYARLRSMGTNGFQEPAIGLEPSGPIAGGTSTGGPGEVCRGLLLRERGERSPFKRTYRLRPEPLLPLRSELSGLSEPNGFMRMVSSTPRMGRPRSWKRSGVAYKRPAKRRKSKNGHSLSTMAEPTSLGKALISIRIMSLSWIVSHIRSFK